MRIVEMFDKKGVKLSNLSLEELDLLVNQVDFTSLSEERFNRFINEERDFKDVILTDLENSLEEEYMECFGLDKKSIQSLIDKLQILNNTQAKELIVAINKARDFFKMFYFTDPVDKMNDLENRNKELLDVAKDSIKIASNATNAADKLNMITDLNISSVKN